MIVRIRYNNTRDRFEDVMDVTSREEAIKESIYNFEVNKGYYKSVELVDCEGESIEDFYEMEIASAGIMRGFMSVPCDLYFTMDAKLSRFLDCSLKLYNVPAQQRAAITVTVLKMDLHAMAADMIQKTIRQAEEGFEALPELPEDGIVQRAEKFLPQKGANP